MSYETILVERQGPATVITFNRPRVHNAMNSQCLAECTAAVAAVEADAESRVLVLRGGGPKAFTAGADISEIQGKGPFEMLGYNRNWLRFFEALERLPKPVLASVHGHAMGGGTELSLACDLVLCSESARFGLAEINIGVIPGAGAAVRLTRWLGRAKAKEILMLGQLIPGREAEAMGLANRCVADDELWPETLRWVEALASKGPLALAAAKASVNVGAEASLPVAMEYELKEFMLLFGTQDQKEGMQAFLEKRKPRFEGR